MVKRFKTLEFNNQVYDISDGTSTTLPNSYGNVKTDIIQKIRQQIESPTPVTPHLSNFTFVSSTQPLFTSVAQTINILYDTPLTHVTGVNLQFRIQLSFPPSMSGNTTITISWVRENNALHSINALSVQNAPASDANTYVIDFKLVFVESLHSISVYVERARNLNTISTERFPIGNYSLFKYKNLVSEEELWGMISNNATNQPLLLMNVSTTSIGFSVNQQFGYVALTSDTWKLFRYPEIYFNATTAVTSSLIASIEQDEGEMYFISAANPPLAQGHVLSFDVGDGEGVQEYVIFLTFTTSGKYAVIRRGEDL